MRIRAVAVVAVLLVSLLAFASTAVARKRASAAGVVPGSYIVVLERSASVSRQLGQQERRFGQVVDFVALRENLELGIEGPAGGRNVDRDRRQVITCFVDERAAGE